MKILLYVHRYGNPYRRFVRNGIDALTARGVEFRILTDFPGSAARGDERVYVLPFSEPPSLWQRLRRRLRLHSDSEGGTLARRVDYYLRAGGPSFTAELRRHLAEFEPDLVHVHFGFTLPLVHRALPDNAPPLLVTFRGVDASAFLTVPKYRACIQDLLSDPRVHTSSVARSLQRELLRFGIPTPRHHLLYSSIDTEFYRRTHSLSTTPPRVYLQISSLTIRKGLHVALRAFARFRKKYPDRVWEYRIGGEGAERATLEQLTQQLELTDSVRFLGAVTPERGKAELERAHVFVHHSITPPDNDMEGIPNAIMEAMSMELPVLASPHSGIPELMEDGVHGRLIPEQDVDRFVGALEQSWSWGLFPQNRVRVEQRFAFGVHADTLQHLYRRVGRNH